MSNIIQPERVFKMGAVELPDPDPQLTPEKALALYAPNYPYLANAVLSPARIDGTRVIYEVEKPPVKTKGARG